MRKAWYSALLCFSIIVASASLAGAETPVGNLKISSTKAGNIFSDGEQVSFMLTAENLPSGGELKVESLDFDGKVAASATKSRYGGGRAVADVSFGAQQIGYYLVRAEVASEGKIISKGESSYAVIVGPEKRTRRESSPFAMDVAASWFFKNEKDLKTVCELLRLAGISCVRDRMAWSGIERSKGTYRWGWYDQSATIQHDSGLTIYQITHDCPTWASGKTDRRYPPKDPADMGSFFRNVVARFKDRVKYWEIWNEADIKTFYIGTPEEYAACLKETYRQIKEADPQAKVLVCSFALAPGEFAEKIFEAGIADSFDIYNVHYYGDPQGVVHRLTNHKKFMEKHGIRKPIWVTEMGAMHHKDRGDSGTLRNEASYLVKAYVYGLANGAERFFYFIFTDFTEEERNFGTVNRDFTPRPAYVALCNLTYFLGEGKFLRKGDETDENVEYHIFQDGDREAAVLWVKEGAARSFRTKGPKVAEAVDVIGRSIPFRNFDDGTFEVQVGPEPVILKGSPR
jgi:hypothetical protein